MKPLAARSRLFALTALFVAVAGCAVGPDYEKPANTLTIDFKNQPLLQRRVGEVPAPPLDSWWTGFAQDAYKGGAVSLVEVLDKDRLLLAARDQLAQLHANDARAAVATFRALGGGWPQDDVVTRK